MEPKDLKNSDELKVMPDIKGNNSKIDIDQVEENVKENVTDEQESGEKLQLADDIRTVSGDDKIISPGSREAEVTDSSAVTDSLAGQAESAAEDLAEQAENPVEEPDLAKQTESATEEPDLAEQAESSAEELAEQAESPVEEPGLAGQAESSTEKPDVVGQTESSTEKSDLVGQTESSAEELAEQTKSPAKGLAEQAESPVEEPGLAGQAESVTEEPDLAGQTKSPAKGLAEQAKSPVEEPGLAGQAESPVEEPGLAEQTESSMKKPDLADFKAEKELRTTVQKVPIPREPSKSRSEASRSEHNDYSKLNMIELINTLRDLLEEAGEKDVKRDIELIKAHFYKKLKEDLELRKKNFIDDGGSEEEFEYEENPYENDIKELLKEYRQRRIDYNKKLEQDKEINLQLKYEVIDEIKTLIHKEESINKTFQEFRELQKRWREIGLVPQSKVKDLWDTYHFHIENFYDYIKINQELRDLDLKKNLEIKIRLCEQAEELLLEPNVIRAFNSLQKLHERWRETGPVPRENKDDIWERFKAATAKINKKHQEYFEIRKTEQRKNFEAKKAICEQIEEINEMELTTHKDWSDRSKEVINFQKVWRTIGFAPQKDNNKIYTRFRTVCDKFFDNKREFYAQNKELQQNNLQLKTDLCIQAEALKDSTDWRKTTNDLINIQKQWKEIGPVPRKQSDILWKRFRAACDYFFDKKAEHFSNIDSEQIENMKLKDELIEEVTNFKASDDVNMNLEKMKEFQRRWTEIGHVPLNKKDDIQKRFRDVINMLFDDLSIDETERNLLKFKTKMATIFETNRGQDKLRMEREKYANKLKQLETDLVLLDNNIGFFAKSKKTESLIKDVKRKIDQTKSKIEFLREKVRVIDEMDQDDD